MPVVHRLQPSFNNGEISPLLYDRVDYNKFVSSVKSGKNMFVHPQGGMSNRAGTMMLAQAKDETVRLIPFEFSSTETYIIEFGNGYCRFFTANGQVVVDTVVDGQTVQVPYEIVSPFTTADLSKIRYCQSGDVMYIAWGGEPKTLTRFGHTNWQFDSYDYKRGPLTEYKEGFEGALSYENDELYITTTEEFDASDIGNKFATKAFFPTQTLSYRVSSQAIAENIKETVFYAGGKITLKTSGTWAGQIHLEESESGTTGWKRVRTFSSTEASADGGSNFDFVSDYTNNDTFLRINLDDLLTFSSSGLNIQLFVEGFYKNLSFIVAEKVDAFKYRVTLIEDNPLIIKYVSGIIYSGDVKARIQSVDNIWGLDSFSVSHWTVTVGNEVKYDAGFTGINGPGGIYTSGFEDVVAALRLAIGDDGSVQYLGGGLQDVTIEQNKEDYSGKQISVRFQSSNTHGSFPSRDVTFGNVFSEVEALTQESSGEVQKFLWQGDTFPTEVDLYQDRIVWATNNELDATKISDYTNFGVSTDVTDDDAISVIIKDKKIDKINSIVAGQKLAVFSDDGNFVHHNDTFTPSTATFLKQGATGGSEVKPVVVRDHIIYAHPMKQALSDYAYNFETDGYAGQEITILANHLFDGKVIKTLAYQQEPYSIIWVLLEDGTVLSCTYLRQQQVIAWTPMDFGGQVKSIAVCSTGTEEHLYLAIKRKNGTFVEKMPTRLLSSNPEDCFFVDCGRTYRGEPATVISGLNYLEGEDVSVLADGNVISGLTVESGAITIPYAASVVTVGLPYESVLETLTFDANLEDGTTKNRKKRVVAVSIRYNKSRGTKLSVNGHREVDMLKRELEGYNIPISLKSGVYREILPSTHNEATNVKIRQIDPLPVTVVSVIPEIEYER